MRSLKTLTVPALFGAALLLSFAGLTACGGGGGGADGDQRSATQVVTVTNAPAQWASIAATALSIDGQLSPMEEARLYAIAFAAAHDALNAVSRQYTPYLFDARAPDADRAAAVAAADYTVLSAQLGDTESAARQYLDEAFGRALLDASGSEAAKQRGIELGRNAARAVLGARAADGAADAQGPYDGTLEWGIYQPTPPSGAARFVNWGRVTPFALTGNGFPESFRPGPPYPPTHWYSYDDYNEVRTLGGLASALRGADRTEIALFWRGSVPSEMLRIAGQTARSRALPDHEQARLVALLGIAMADSSIAAFDTKYFYRYWRPYTAIHAFDTNDPNTPADPDWVPLIAPAPPDPEYVSAPAAAAGAAAAVLRVVHGTDDVGFTHASASLPGVTRSYGSFSQMAQEIADAGVYSGHQFRNGAEQGRLQGLAVGEAVAKLRLMPVR